MVMQSGTMSQTLLKPAGNNRDMFKKHLTSKHKSISDGKLIDTDFKSFGGNGLTHKNEGQREHP